MSLHKPDLIEPALDLQPSIYQEDPNGSSLPVISPLDRIKQVAEHDLRKAASEFMLAVALHKEAKPASRETTIDLHTLNPSEFALNDWQPAEVFAYTSDDPFQASNPELTAASTKWIESVMEITRRYNGHRDPELAYLSGRRAASGRKMTLATKVITETDQGISDWVTHLPKAERLRPVAQPWEDVSTVVYDKAIDGLKEIAGTPALRVLVGGASDGRAVREREAWERQFLASAIDVTSLRDNTLRITSIGTGTGEPAMDTGLSIMRQNIVGGRAGRVEVTGFDIKQDSLKVAEYIANCKKTSLDNSEALKFIPIVGNILSEEGIKQAVADTSADIYEAIGFAEYVPSDNTADPIEQQMREAMKRMCLLSAEEFYRVIYENMPSGSILVTGNMRDDSPQGDFVIDGLGWPGIIRRGTAEYLTIIKQAGIPGDAVKLFVPDKYKSAGTYNLIAITKQ